MAEPDLALACACGRVLAVVSAPTAGEQVLLFPRCRACRGKSTFRLVRASPTSVIQHRTTARRL